MTNAMQNQFFMDNNYGIDTVDNGKNYVIDDTMNVDVNLDALKRDGITEDEIDEMFNLDDDAINSSIVALDKKDKKTMDKLYKMQKQAKKKLDDDIVLVKKFVDNPTHDNFNKLWERFYFGVKGHAFKFMRDWDLADDMTVQTFTRAWEFRDKYDIEKAKFSTWLYTICRNLCLGEINKRNKENIVGNDISDMFDSAMLNTSSAMSTNSTQYTVEKGDIIANSADDLMMRMYDTSINEIEKMGGNYAKVLKMKLVDDMKIREIANQLNMNESTVKNYLYKGKETLESIMKTKHKGLYEMYLESAGDEAAKMM